MITGAEGYALAGIVAGEITSSVSYATRSALDDGGAPFLGWRPIAKTLVGL